MELRDVQLCELQILDEIIRICDKYHLKYSLSYGTFLGAVRHKGFIPWDDDLDIDMPLKDFKEFEKICKTELNAGYFLQTQKNDKAPFPFYKVRMNGTKMIESIYRDLPIHHGIWVDIFPYVYSARSQNGKRLQMKMLTILNRIRARFYYLYGLENCSRIRKIFYHLPDLFFRIADMTTLKTIEILGSSKSNTIFELTRANRFSDYFFKSDFFEVQSKYLFEKKYYYGPKDYDGYLTKCYGDQYLIPKKYGSHANDEDISIRI